MAGLSVVLLKWADAHSGAHHWHALGEIEDDGEYIVQSVGWLIPVDEGGKDGHVTLAQSMTPDADVDHVLHVPVGMVRSMSVCCTFEGRPIEEDTDAA